MGAFHSVHNEQEEIRFDISDDADDVQTAAGTGSTPRIVTDFKPSSVQQLCWPGRAALEVEDVPVMVVRLPAKTLSLADNPYPIHNDTRATFDSNNRNHPQSLDNCSLLVLALSSLQFLIEGSR